MPCNKMETSSHNCNKRSVRKCHSTRVYAICGRMLFVRPKQRTKFKHPISVFKVLADSGVPTPANLYTSASTLIVVFEDLDFCGRALMFGFTV